ncbi:MAG TPA: MFS transporter [Burkholderiales bacterium]|nr:MFS transporter [Burkholderiales bacterium]
MARSQEAAAPQPAAPLRFAALRHPGYRAYFATTAAAMMADNIEHVISYWVIFEKFHSPELGGFAVISHWVPFLLFSVYSGYLADRFDPRRVIQLGMAFFMFVSLAWGLLFVTDTLEVWHACVLLVIHGFAGVLWGPASQMLIHDIVGPAHLQSAVRLNATARWLGIFLGPAVGGGLMLALGPAIGILINALIYLPIVFWLWKAPYGPRFRKEPPLPVRAVRGLGEIAATIRDVAGNRTIVSMILLAGSAAFFVGHGYQPQMPGFAHDLGHGDAGLLYSMLLGANAAGAFIAGIALESRGLLPPNPRTALILAVIWCVAIVGFATSELYFIALPLLFVAGFLELSFNAMAMTLVQLQAPPNMRGRVIGLYNMGALGLRAFSGITIGVVGGLIGIHWSLALSAMVLLAIIITLLTFSTRPA